MFSASFKYKIHCDPYLQKGMEVIQTLKWGNVFHTWLKLSELEGKGAPFLTYGIRVCSFFNSSGILICVIEEKIYVVFREDLSECLPQSMTLNCQTIVALMEGF